MKWSQVQLQLLYYVMEIELSKQHEKKDPIMTGSVSLSTLTFLFCSFHLKICSHTIFISFIVLLYEDNLVSYPPLCPTLWSRAHL